MVFWFIIGSSLVSLVFLVLSCVFWFIHIIIKITNTNIIILNINTTTTLTYNIIIVIQIITTGIICIIIITRECAATQSPILYF